MAAGSTAPTAARLAPASWEVSSPTRTAFPIHLAESWAGEAGSALSLDPGSPVLEPELHEALPSHSPLLIQTNFPSLIIISNQRATGSTVALPGKEGAEPSLALTGPPESEDNRHMVGRQTGDPRLTHAIPASHGTLARHLSCPPSELLAPAGYWTTGLLGLGLGGTARAPGSAAFLHCLHLYVSTIPFAQRHSCFQTLGDLHTSQLHPLPFLLPSGCLPPSPKPLPVGLLPTALIEMWPILSGFKLTSKGPPGTYLAHGPALLCWPVPPPLARALSYLPYIAQPWE